MSWSQCPPANTRISRPTQTLHKANQAPPSESRFGLLWQLLRTYHGCHFNAELPESFPILADWSGSSTPRHRSHDPGIATTSSDGQQLLLHLRSLEQPPRLPRTRRKPLSRGHARSPVRCHPMCRQWSIVAAAVARDPGDEDPGADESVVSGGEVRELAFWWRWIVVREMSSWRWWITLEESVAVGDAVRESASWWWIAVLEMAWWTWWISSIFFIRSVSVGNTYSWFFCIVLRTLVELIEWRFPYAESKQVTWLPIWVVTVDFLKYK